MKPSSSSSSAAAGSRLRRLLPPPPPPRLLLTSSAVASAARRAVRMAVPRDIEASAFTRAARAHAVRSSPICARLWGTSWWTCAARWRRGLPRLLPAGGHPPPAPPAQSGGRRGGADEHFDRDKIQYRGSSSAGSASPSALARHGGPVGPRAGDPCRLRARRRRRAASCGATAWQLCYGWGRLCT